MRFRYANGGSANRPGDIYVNSHKLVTETFTPTGGVAAANYQWSSWHSVGADPFLLTPAHSLEVRLATGTATEGPNIASLEIKIDTPFADEHPSALASKDGTPENCELRSGTALDVQGTNLVGFPSSAAEAATSTPFVFDAESDADIANATLTLVHRDAMLRNALVCSVADSQKLVYGSASSCADTPGFLDAPSAVSGLYPPSLWGAADSASHPDVAVGVVYLTSNQFTLIDAPYGLNFTFNNKPVAAGEYGVCAAGVSGARYPLRFLEIVGVNNATVAAHPDRYQYFANNSLVETREILKPRVGEHFAVELNGQKLNPAALVDGGYAVTK